MDKSQFSSSGEFLAVCSPDGRLRIWEIADKVSTLKQEFVPSSHLSARCTCLAWAPAASKGKRKRNKVTGDSDVVGLGTADGSILLYSVAKAQLLSHSTEGHAGEVTGIVWGTQKPSLYTCGEDGYIVEWDPESLTTTSRWKGAKGPLSAISTFRNMLLTSGRGITLWDLETKTSTMRFLGQPSTVDQIMPISNTEYFVTMSFREMHLQIWSKTEQSAVATLTLTENPRHVGVISNKEGRIDLAVVTENGRLCTFQHKLNGPLRKPLAPSCVLTIVDANDANSAQVHILICCLLGSDDSSTEVKLVYGNWLKLKSESMNMKYLCDSVTIKREFGICSKSSKNKRKDKQRGTDVEMTEVPKDAKHLQPGNDTNPALGINEEKGTKRKKKEKTKQDEDELPMEERLSNLTIATSSSIPEGNNLAHLLSQGLHSKDTKIIQSVLSRWDQDVIDNTINSLPVQLVSPLLDEVKKALCNKPLFNYSAVRWLKAIFKVHSAFLMSCPSSDELLGPFFSLLHSRETLYPQMRQLKGKLELIKGNIQAKEHRLETPNEALLVYHDESTSDEEEDMMPSESEEFIGSDDLMDDDSASDKMDESNESDSDSDDDDEEDKDKTASKVNGDGGFEDESDDD